MRAFFFILLAFAIGFGLLYIGQVDPDNYVKVYMSGYVIEISVIQFSILLLLTILVLYVVIRLLRILFQSTTLWSNWRQKKKSIKAQEALGVGYLSLIKGNWSLAEKSLTRTSSDSSLPYVNFLGAAQAAQEQGKLSSRDDYLNEALKAAPSEHFAIGLTKARLHQKAGQLEKALATLNDIASEGKKNAQFTAMLLQTYEQMGNWSGVQSLMPTAKKQKALPADLLQRMYHQSYVAALHAADDKEAAWSNLPKDEKKNPENVAIYAAYLISKDQSESAEKLIRNELKVTWSDELVSLYGSLKTDKPAKLRRYVEGWLMARPENAELNLAAGRFALLEKNEDKAVEYLQKAIETGALPLAYSLLGKLYEDTSDSGKALDVYRNGMSAASNANMKKLISLDDNEVKAISGDLVLSEDS